MSTHELTHEQILDAVRGHESEKVKLAIVDIDGILRGKYINKQKFLSAADKGFGFCNVVFGWDCNDTCYDSVSYTGWHTGYPDASAQIDLNTYRNVPWDKNVPFFLADFIDSSGNPLNVCPRQLLKSVIKRMEAANYRALFGVEYEWFNFKETPDSLAEKRYTGMSSLSPGMFGYSMLRSSYLGDYFNALMDDLLKFKVPIEGIHTETGPGVYEAALVCTDPLEAADQAVLLKTGVKEIAYKHGIMPSFMAKWHADLPGCSGHIHQSLWDKDAQHNLFYDKSDKHGMSDTFRSFLAGQLVCLPEILPFFAPNINSYKRLVEGLWAPTQANWGIDNRTASLRLIPGTEKSTHLETRVPGADINPYLAIAACLASGLYGLDRKLELTQEAVSGNAYQDKSSIALPRNLLEATEKLAQSKIARELFGAPFVEHFVETRLWEWQKAQEAVTDWEIQRYFEII